MEKLKNFIGNILIILILSLKTYIVGTCKNRLAEAVLTSTHNVCIRSKIRKLGAPCKPQFFYIKLGLETVYISRTCIPDVFSFSYARVNNFTVMSTNISRLLSLDHHKCLERTEAKLLNEPHHEKTGILPMRKQRLRSAVQ